VIVKNLHRLKKRKKNMRQNHQKSPSKLYNLMMTLFLLMMIVMTMSQACAVTATLTWNHTPEIGADQKPLPTVGYNLYYGEVGQPLSEKIILGSVQPLANTVYPDFGYLQKLTTLAWQEGKTYCVELTAYKVIAEIKYESPRSNRDCVEIKVTLPGAPTGLKLSSP
jgi:hypothetical protein